MTNLERGLPPGSLLSWACGGRRRRPSDVTPAAAPKAAERSAAGRPGKRQRRAGTHVEAGAKRRPEHAEIGRPGKRQRRADTHVEAGAKRRPEHARDAAGPGSASVGRYACGGRSERRPAGRRSTAERDRPQAGPGSASVGPARMWRQERSDARNMQKTGLSSTGLQHPCQHALLAQSAEHSHGKAGVVGSIPTEGSPAALRGPVPAHGGVAQTVRALGS